MKFKTTLKTSPSLIDLTPLVDVIFLLLIFFVVTSDILPLKSLYIEHPKLPQNTDPLTTQLLVVMDVDHVIYIGSKKNIADLVSLEELIKKELQTISRIHPDANPTIVLSVDRRVEYGSFLKVFSILQTTQIPVRLVFQHEDA